MQRCELNVAQILSFSTISLQPFEFLPSRSLLLLQLQLFSLCKREKSCNPNQSIAREVEAQPDRIASSRNAELAKEAALFESRLS